MKSPSLDTVTWFDEERVACLIENKKRKLSFETRPDGKLSTLVVSEGGRQINDVLGTPEFEYAQGQGA